VSTVPGDHDPVAAEERLLHLRTAGVSLVIDCRGERLPRVVHWGADLGELTPAQLADLASASVAPSGSGEPDEPTGLPLVPEHATGWPGLPGLTGHRDDGTGWSPYFSVVDVHRSRPDDDEGSGTGSEGSGTGDDGPGTGAGERLAVTARDDVAGLRLDLVVELLASGLVRLMARVHNTDPDAAYTVQGLVLALPVPTRADELLDLTGRWTRERVPQRQPFHHGVRLRDNRRGRTGFDTPLVFTAGTTGFGFQRGEVWGLHVGFSGNHRHYAERLPSGRSLLGGGELLLAGEVRLTPGRHYETPWVYASYGHGLDALSARFHKHLRSRPRHPRTTRPVVLNTWEAVYFDHDLDRLKALADVGARVGAERFVLDDGWFRHRRDDTAGLGDWYVDEGVWPQGLWPLVEHVRGLGLQFGLWVEPEMVNPDSDLARAHPDWILATGGRQPPPVRNQQVLNLGDPAAYGYVLDRLDALVGEYDLGYLKWDHNRDLVDAGQAPDGAAGVHAQTRAVYRLLDELRARHPGLEIESCSSGGARADLGILQRTDRIWGSDCIDALERQSIQRWTALLLPPELVGSHVGAPRSHTTTRTHDLSFRAGTALFGHFGIEWDLTRATPDELAELTGWIALYKRLRGLLHTGTVVRADHPDPALWVHGVVAADRGAAVYAVVAMAHEVTYPPGRVGLPGLDPAVSYRVRALPPGDQVNGPAAAPGWLADGVCLPGRVLGEVGVQVPGLSPEHLVLLEVTRA
jgi:alpha-galactosidase